MSVPTDIGGAISVVPASTTNAAAGTITSAAINRFGLNSAVIKHSCGPATGTPDTFSVATKLQHADTSGGAYTDVTGGGLTNLTADSTAATLDISLLPTRQYLKTVTVVTFVNGTSPKIPVDVTVILGGSDHGPVS